MTIDELKQVLTKIQLGDSRQVDRLILAEWNDTIGDLDYHDAIAAVTMHRRESTAYLLPAHIIANVKRIREDRAQSFGIESFEGAEWAPRPDNFDALVAAAKDPVRWVAEVAKYNRQLADAGLPEVHP